MLGINELEQHFLCFMGNQSCNQVSCMNLSLSAVLVSQTILNEFSTFFYI